MRISILFPSSLALLTLFACASEPGTGSEAKANAGSGGAPVNAAGSGGITVSAGASTAGASSSGGDGQPSGGNASSGAAGMSGGAAGGVEAARPSLGCGKDSELEPGVFASSMVAGRNTWLRLPTDYDPARAYPVIFMWKGCSAAGRSTFGMENVAGHDAIIAQADFAPGADCYDTADGAQFVDLPVFDALLAQIQEGYCVDQAHVFSVGFSSGAWLTQLLACQRGDVLRGIGTIAGAFKPTFLNGAAACKGSGLSAFMVSDLSDHTNPFYDEDVDGDSVEVAVNHWLNANGCAEKAWSMDAGMPAAPDPSVCRSYADCGRFPVELCLTSDKGHAAQESLSMPGFWQLFKQSLPL